MLRPRLFAALTLCALGGFARATDTRPFDDAPLNAVQFVDKQEGWAAGSDGVVWHTIDGGKHWERQSTGVRAALRSVYFINPYTGWAVGREELPHAGGSSGVVLFTDDGGLRWTKLPGPPLPGLNCVRFFDDKTGIVAGDGSDVDPSGLFATRDGGQTWHPAPGSRCPTWWACDYRDPDTGVLAGAWGRLATIRGGIFAPADVDKLGGRGVRAIQVQGRTAVAAGQNGLVLVSRDSAGDQWGFVDMHLPEEVAAGCDFDAVALVDQNVWVTGRPGSVVFHSADLGKTWEAQLTGQSLPLHALHFRDAQNGWAVGELGTILATTDGGRSWTVQRRGGQRAAVLFVHARPDDAALETVATVGAEDGYLTAAIRVTAADPAAVDYRHAADRPRWVASQRLSGGAAGDCLTFPLPEHLGDADRAELLAAWERQPASRRDQLVRQLTLAIRSWRPEVIVTDFVGAAPEAVVVDAVREAYRIAADATAFPEQSQICFLKPWQAKKLYAAWTGGGVSPVVLRADEPCRHLAETPRDYAASGYALLCDQPAELPAQRSYRLLASAMPGADGHGDLMAGTALATGGAARRAPWLLDFDSDRTAEAEKGLRDRKMLQTLSKPDWGKLSDSGALLAQIGPLLNHLPAEQGGSAAFAIASKYAQAGQWHLAREAFLLMVDRYPKHPLAADAYRWLVAFHSSSEARRREELGQFLVRTRNDIHQAATAPGRDNPLRAGITPDSRGLTESTQVQQTTLMSDQAGARKWYQGALEVEPRLTALSALRANDPAVQFALQAARRRLGDFDAPKKWYREFLAGRAADGRDDPWRSAAAAELWLTDRSGPAPKAISTCRKTAARPFLDGKLDDDCWRDAQPLVLKSAGGDTAGFTTTARIAYDAEYLYVAVECARPPGRVIPAVEKRTHDADLRAFDRVGILIDLDRDYQTYFHLQIDERGALADDCWGDRGWNPSWFVASKAGPEGWTAEAAIPLNELTGDAPTIGQVWAVNVVRVLPGRGVQAWSLPADVRPRPEGLGLLMFVGDPKAKP
jgi:photosystem II stability/assembly factor-like uncharacterized protein/tetratricopeptide (TPR) repeat protein